MNINKRVNEFQNARVWINFKDETNELIFNPRIVKIDGSNDTQFRFKELMNQYFTFYC